MAKKKPSTNGPRIAKVAPRAISLRSNSVSEMTLLIDQSYLALVSNKFDPIREATRPRQQANFDQLRQWAGRGQWLAVESLPEILDADAVPALDLVFSNSKKKTGKASTSRKANDQINAPSDGHWFDPLTQYLDLPTGKLCVIYDDMFFHRIEKALKESYPIASRKDEEFGNRNFLDATSYIIDCKPGLYKAHSFTRFLESDFPSPGLAPDLAIYLTSAPKPKSFKSSPAVMPYQTEQQDIAALRRASQGLPPRRKQNQKPTLLKSGIYKANVHIGMSMTLMDMPKSFRDKLRLDPGKLVTLEMEGIQIRGMMTTGQAPHPAFMKIYKEHESESSWFAMFKSVGDTLLIDVTKQSAEGFGLVEGESTVGKFRVDEVAAAEEDSPKKALKAKGHPDAIPIPNKVGKPGPKVAALIPKIERCFSWTQICLFEVRGKTMVGAVNVCPPDKASSMAAEISGTIAPFKDGQVGKETMKSFRGFPGGVDRAFAWIAGHGKGGYLWTTYFEVDLNFFNKRTRVSQKEALPASIAAWREVFGVEVPEATKPKAKSKRKAKGK